MALFDVAGLSAAISDLQEATDKAIKRSTVVTSDPGFTGLTTDPTFAHDYSHHFTEFEFVAALGLAALLFFAARNRYGGVVTAVTAGVTTVLTLIIQAGSRADVEAFLIVVAALAIVIIVKKIIRSSAQVLIVVTINFAAAVWTLVSAGHQFVSPLSTGDTIAIFVAIMLVGWVAWWALVATFGQALLGGPEGGYPQSVLDFMIGLAGIGATICVAYLREAYAGVNDLFVGVGITLIWYVVILIIRSLPWDVLIKIYSFRFNDMYNERWADEDERRRSRREKDSQW